MEFSAHAEASAEELSYFYNLFKKGKYELPVDTQEALQRKIDVNIGEKGSKTINSLLYTGGGIDFQLFYKETVPRNKMKK